MMAQWNFAQVSFRNGVYPQYNHNYNKMIVYLILKYLTIILWIKTLYIFFAHFLYFMANATAPCRSIFLFLDLKKMLKFKQWLAAWGNYCRLTPAHEGAALGHCLNLNIFFKPRNKKSGENIVLKQSEIDVSEIYFYQTLSFFLPEVNLPPLNKTQC